MARYHGPVCKLCRRERMKLFLKGAALLLGKNASVTRRPYPPGQHGQARIKLSEYAVRLREKQKVRRIYGVLERQFQKYYAEATRRKGRTGEEMLGQLESRLDSVVHRLGFAFTRAQARQIIRHNHVLVNGKRLNISSVILRAGDKVEIRPSSREMKDIVASLATVEKRPMLSWLELDKVNFAGTYKWRSGVREVASTSRRSASSSSSSTTRDNRFRRFDFCTGRRRAPPESGFDGWAGIAA